MNPDFYERFERFSAWKDYIRNDYEKMYDELERYYNDDNNFNPGENELRYSSRDMRRMQDEMCIQLEESTDEAAQEAVYRMENELKEAHYELERCRAKLSKVSNLEHKISLMEKLLDQYALYSEIDYDKNNFVLIGV